VKIAACQIPLLATHSMDVLSLIRARVDCCESEGVSILCCPEGVLGGLADYATDPSQFAISVGDGELESILAPLASDTVTTIIGFTERGENGRLYNSAAVYYKSSTIGVYRKLHPAINRSVYDAGQAMPVFQVGALTFGIVICNDSNYSEPAQHMAAQGAAVLFIPSNNGLPHGRAGEELISWARRVDIARAVENSLWVIRADVAGRTDELVSHGSSGIVDPDGMVVQEAKHLSEDLLVVEITPQRRPAAGKY
jgi:predicted amidohydrolase